ncbi:MAG TPA: hypothetical protein VK939_12025 [Longimicrobiales bacterium]|nr:hypothetical protein [Longimicrobiales bacterium]
MIISLVAFHRFLIAAAIVFCLGYAGWEIHAWREAGAGGVPALALLFLALGVGLALYLKRLGRFLGYDREAGPPR